MAITENKKYLFAAGLPVLFLIALICKAGVNTPFWDEWELVPIFQHLHAGHFYFSDFWAQHNEHRIFFPTLVLIWLAKLTRWNIQLENFVNLAVAMCSFGVLTAIIIARKTVGKGAVMLIFLLALIWFSPAQAENWLWGWQVEWFMNVLGVMIVAYGLSRIRDRSLSYGTLALILGGGTLAQFSLGSGTLVWPIALAVLFYKRTRAPWVIVTCLTALAATFLYFFKYLNLTDQSKSLALHEPLHFIAYVLGYLGRPLSMYHKPAMAIGLLLLAAFVGLNAYLFARHKRAFAENLPWLFLGLYAIGAAVVTGLARLNFGVNEAFSDRYITISSLLLVSVAVSYWRNGGLARKMIGSSYAVLKPAVIIGVFALVIIQAGWGVHAARIKHRQLVAIQACTRLPVPTEPCLLSTYPNAPILSERLNYVKSIHWGGY